MFRRLAFVLATIIAIGAILIAQLNHSNPSSPVHGRNGTVLFLTTEAPGFSNVHLATVSALLRNHPDMDVHYASFPALKRNVLAISAAAQETNPSCKPLQWHELPGPDFRYTFNGHWPSVESMISGVGTTDYAKKIDDLIYGLAPWAAEDHWNCYTAIISLIDMVNPELIVLDNLLAPATDLARNSERRFVSLVPNAVLELIAADQPRGAMLWKYPAAFTGFPFPLPKKLVPTNIWLTIRLAYNLIVSPVLSAKRAFLAERGIQDPIELSFVIKDTPVLAGTMKEANIPMDVYPSYVTFCGPIALDTAPAEEQAPELVSWLKQAPTLLINLGTLFAYSEQRARTMADALSSLLSDTEYQILWKFKKVGDYSDDVFSGIQENIDTERVRMRTWLEADPVSLLQTGHIVLSVHHGGANSYHEAVLAGIPHMILPLWFDLYNIANTAEYIGVGIWAGREIAPEWAVDSLVDGFRSSLEGPKSLLMREKAKELGRVAKAYGGSHAAAAEIARLATYTL
jgi:hypothetical protein